MTGVPETPRRITGALGYHGGLAAEEIAEAAYLRAGHILRARRWRGEAGEIDLIFAAGAGLRFVEVKKARNHGAAAARVSPAQQARVQLAAQEYLGAMGLSLDTDMQFDVALVDGQGRLTILEAAFP